MQDSDGANGQVSPNSAMSISPASSEVGSCLVNGTTASASSLNRSSKKPGTKSTTTKESSNNPSSSQQHNTTSSGSKKLIKGNHSNSARNTNSSRINQQQQQQPVVDRSDLDLNWRQSKVSSSNTTTKTLSADEDPNWRDHKTDLNSKTSLAKMSKSKHSNNELGYILYFICSRTFLKNVQFQMDIFGLNQRF